MQTDEVQVWDAKFYEKWEKVLSSPRAVQGNENVDLAANSEKAARVDWVGLLERMWAAVDKTVDERRLSIYAEEFKDIPFGLLEKSVSRAIRNNGAWLTVPSVGALWAAIRKETGDMPNMDVMEAVQLWTNQRAGFIYRFEKATNE